MEALIPGLFGVLMMVMFVVAISVGMRQGKRARVNLQRLAADLGLEAIQPPKRRFLPAGMGSVKGNYRGRFVRIYSYTTGSGKSRTHWCAIEAKVQNPAKLTFNISRESFLTRTVKVFGMQEARVGDEMFDRAFFMRTNQAEYLRMALIPEVRSRMLGHQKIAGSRGSFTANDLGVKYAEVGSFSNERLISRFPQAVEVVCDLADIVETYQPSLGH